MELALRYLNRYSCTRSRMRRHLSGKVRASVEADAVTEDGGAAWTAAVLARLERSGLVDDVRFAAGRAEALVRRGKSLIAIRRDLRVKGVPAEQVDAAITGLVEADGPDPQLVAACAYARRRRLGPWYTGVDRRERRDKHLAALARSGFSWSVARRIIDAADPESLEADLDG